MALFDSFKDKASQKAFHEKCNDYLVMLTIVSFPISIKISNYALFALAFNWLIYTISLKENLGKNRGSVLINISPFLFSAVTLIYCDDLVDGLHNIEKFLPLLAFPVVFNTIATRKNHQFFSRVFLFCILYMCAISFGYGLYNFIFFDELRQELVGDFFNRVPGRWNTITNVNLMRPFSINPIYMSLYVSFAFFVALYEKFSAVLVKVSVMGFLAVFQFLIGSRIGLLAFFLSLFVAVFLTGSKQRKVYFSMLAILIFVASMVVIFVNPILKKRFIDDLASISPPKTVEGWNAINIRLAIWDCSWEVFKEAPIIGYGVKSQESPRDACYQEKYTFYGPFGTKLNSHNQFMEFALIGGVVLLGLFLVQLIYSLRVAFQKDNKLHLIFIALFTITCLGESVLDTQKGLMFFALFNSMFIYYHGEESAV